MNKLPNRIKFGEKFYSAADLTPEAKDLFLKYQFAASREDEVKKYLLILTEHKISIALEIKREILSSKGGFDLSMVD